MDKLTELKSVCEKLADIRNNHVKNLEIIGMTTYTPEIHLKEKMFFSLFKQFKTIPLNGERYKYEYVAEIYSTRIFCISEKLHESEVITYE